MLLWNVWQMVWLSDFIIWWKNVPIGFLRRWMKKNRHFTWIVLTCGMSSTVSICMPWMSIEEVKIMMHFFVLLKMMREFCSLHWMRRRLWMCWLNVLFPFWKHIHWRFWCWCAACLTGVWFRRWWNWKCFWWKWWRKMQHSLMRNVAICWGNAI